MISSSVASVACDSCLAGALLPHLVRAPLALPCPLSVLPCELARLDCEVCVDSISCSERFLRMLPRSLTLLYWLRLCRGCRGRCVAGTCVADEAGEACEDVIDVLDEACNVEGTKMEALLASRGRPRRFCTTRGSRIRRRGSSKS
jgi:hypothetical protein